jgi:SAM-dependent methyltransferase
MNTLLLDIIEWDVVNWSFCLDLWEEHTSQDLATVSALELGSRHGGLSLWLALKGSLVKCTDLEGPTALAVEKHKKYDVSHLVEYESVDGLKIPYEEQFDVILFKSILGGIGWGNQLDNQRQAIQEIYKALKPGGELFFVENLVASPLHQFLRKNFVKWGNSWRYVTIPEMVSFLSPFSKVEFQANGFLGALGRTELQHEALGKLDQRFFNQIVPEHWKYILAGVAQK